MTEWMSTNENIIMIHKDIAAFMHTYNFSFFDPSEITNKNCIPVANVYAADNYHPGYYSYECVV